MTDIATHPEGDGESDLEATHLELYGEAQDYELDDVVTFLRRHERDQALGIAVPPLAELIDALERGEHRK